MDMACLKCHGVAVKSQNSWRFSPSKVSHYTVCTLGHHIVTVIFMHEVFFPELMIAGRICDLLWEKGPFMVVWNKINFYHDNVQLAFYKCSSEYTCISVLTSTCSGYTHRIYIIQVQATYDKHEVSNGPFLYNTMVAKLGKDFPVKILAIILCNSNILENYACTWAANANFYLRFWQKTSAH